MQCSIPRVLTDSLLTVGGGAEGTGERAREGAEEGERARGEGRVEAGDGGEGRREGSGERAWEARGARRERRGVGWGVLN